jgi:hypothetical protein
MHSYHARAGLYNVDIHCDGDYRGDIHLTWRVADGFPHTPWTARVPADHLLLSYSDGMPFLAGSDEPILLDDINEPIPACVLIAAALVLQKERIRSELMQAMEML